ncbi:DUF7289 family protein [Halorarius litoreus]|uniref:DUF7289 family protein n=1 Tax=Halorarius litoreus TaxID=2962676 RepID=UPI0020CC4D6E|nr:hypothetical protein [Halorarius litoreus]
MRRVTRAARAAARRRPAPSTSRDRRALTPLVGVLLLVVIVILGSTVAVLVADEALGGTRKSVEVARAEGAMTQLDARVSDTALGSDGTAGRAVDFGHIGPDGQLGTSRESWMRVAIVNATTGVEDATVVNATLGTVTYAHSGTTIAYEGGGVWRGDGENTTMLSPPEFHFRNTTLTLPIVSVDGDPALGERLQVAQTGPAVRKYPNETAGLTNRVADAKVAVTVHSDYYLAWGAHFEDATDGYVTYDHDARTVTVTFLSIPKWTGLNDGIVATSGSGEVKVTGTGAYIDSYNSSVGTGSYDTTKGADAVLSVVTDLTNSGDLTMLGDLRSGATVTMGGNTNISGSVYWTDAYDQNGNSVHIDGSIEQIDGIAPYEPIDRYVLHVVDAARTANNNTEAGIVDDRISGSATLGAGTYYLRSIDIGPGNRLELDTTDGDIVVAVEDTVVIEGNGGNAAALNVSGDGTVTMFVIGDQPVDFEVGKNAEVSVPGERATQFRVYGTQDLDVVILSNQGKTIRFEGVIYAPAGYTGTGSTTVGQAEFFGAIVTGQLDVPQYAEIHYDLGLSNEQFPRAPYVSRLEFMHVAVHPVDVTNR